MPTSKKIPMPRGGRMWIDCHWPGHGRCRIDLPNTMTEKERAEFFQEMIGWETSPKQPLDFGDSNRPKTDVRDWIHSDS